MQICQELITLNTETGPMQCQVWQPLATHRRYAAIMLYSEIFQITAPIARMAAMLAGQGFIVVVPEIFHELNPLGTVLAYDDLGKNKGNQDKWTKPLSSYDSDNRAIIGYLQSHPRCDGRIGAFGVCIGGHLAFRAALQPEVLASICLYATDLHTDTLPGHPQTLALAGNIQGQLMMIWGRQDPHIPQQGRADIQQSLLHAGCRYSWHEFDANHAFMRDEGERYDPALALWVYQQASLLFHQMPSLEIQQSMLG